MVILAVSDFLVLGTALFFLARRDLLVLSLAVILKTAVIFLSPEITASLFLAVLDRLVPKTALFFLAARD